MNRFYINAKAQASGATGVLVKVMNLTAEISSDDVMVSWDSLHAVYDISEYILERKVNDGQWVIDRTLETADFFGFVIDLETEVGSTYYYRVRAKNSEGHYTDYSNEASITIEDQTDEVAPVITLTGGNVTIEEGEPYVEPGYSATDNVDGDITANVVVNYGGLNVTDPSEGVFTITYNVSDATGNAATQRTRTVTVESVSIGLPDAPTNLTATVVNDYRIDLSWDAPSGTVTGYNIDINNGSGWQNIEANTNSTDTTYSVTNLDPNSYYEFRVSAINSEGAGDDSNIANATTTNSGASDTDFLAVKTRIENAGGALDDNLTQEIISYFKSIGKYDSNLHFIHKSTGHKLDVNNKVEVLFDIGPNPFDMTAPDETKRVALDSDNKWMLFTGTTYYTMGSNYPYPTTAMTLGAVAQPTGGADPAFILDFGRYVAEGYGLAIGLNETRAYLPNINHVHGFGIGGNGDKAIQEIRAVLGNATGFKVFKNNQEILVTNAPATITEANIDEYPTNDAEQGPFTFGGCSKISQPTRTFIGKSAGFYFYGAPLSTSETEGLNAILADYYNIGGVTEPPPNPDFTFERVSYRSHDLSTGKHVMFQRYLCPAYLADPDNANVKTVIWTGGLGSNGTDSIANLIADDGYPKRIVTNGDDYDYNVFSIQQESGSYSIQSILDIVDFIGQHVNNFDPNKLILIGWSAGHLPVTALKNIPERIEAAILFDPAYDMVGPATTPAVLAGGAKIWLFSDSQSSYVGGMRTMWNAMRSDVNFDSEKHKFTEYTTGNHNVINKTFLGTGGATVNTDGRSSYPGDPAFTMNDFILEAAIEEPTDETAPTVPDGLVEGGKSHNSATWNWNASTDNIGVTGYKVSLNNGTAIDVGNVLTYTAFTLSPETTYNLRVLAYDAAGNESAYTSNVSITTEVMPTLTLERTVKINVNGNGSVSADPEWTTYNESANSPEPILKSGFTDTLGNVVPFTLLNVYSETYRFWQNATATPTPANSSIFPDDVMGTSMRLAPAYDARLILGGLDQSKRYKFLMSGLTRFVDPNNDVIFKIGEESHRVVVASNLTDAAVFETLFEPDSNGEILIEVNNAPDVAAGGALSGIIVEVWS